jgi:hypothetical protein
MSEIKINKIIELLEENNKILKNIENEIISMKESTDKMDTHIDEVMTIYDSYKKPLNYISDKFNSGINLLKITNE